MEGPRVSVAKEMSPGVCFRLRSQTAVGVAAVDDSWSAFEPGGSFGDVGG